MFSKNSEKLLFFASLTLMLTACGGGSSSTGAALDNSGDGLARGLLTACESVRNQACTREYRPVCGLNEADTFETFANSCTACANETIQGFVPGACSLSQLTACNDPRPNLCTADYRPACGVSVERELKTYANSCNACSDTDVIGFTVGECPTP